MSEPDPHNVRIQFGKYCGERFTRLPLSYLRWMVRTSTRDAALAEAELNRRGKGLHEHDIEITGHAVDTASLRLWAEFLHDHGEREGLHAWLQRVAAEALAGGEVDRKGRAIWRERVLLAYEQDGPVAVVKTVMRRKKRS